MQIRAPKGTKDIFGKEIFIWQLVESTIRKICNTYGFTEIRTPVFEYTELFTRGVGEETDIVQKEMYTFLDKANRSITLRPEGTASTVRAYIENSMYQSPQPIKVYYIYPVFRYEKPQEGRQRQFHQFGIETLGSDEPITDVEIMSVAKALIDAFGIQNTELRINCLGTGEARSNYVDALKEFIVKHYDSLCPTCRERIETNPLRVLDCKINTCEDIVEQAPNCLDYLDDECKNHFEEVKRLLTEMGIAYVVDPKIVRGLDYYTKTVFEFLSYDLGAQKTICGGGRYNNMVKEFDGPDTPAIGFGLGIERLILALKSLGAVDNIEFPVPEYFVGAIGETGLREAGKLVYELRKNGISAEGDLMKRSVKAQLKFADKIGAQNTIIIGDDEIEKGIISVKNMETGETVEKPLKGFAESLRQ